jgi:hypothetical protein
MRKSYLVLVTAAGLLLAVGVSAEAGGGRSGIGPQGNFPPPGFSHNTTGQLHSGTGGAWQTNSTTGVQPPGWSHNPIGQLNGNWSGTSLTGTGGAPHGLSGH